MPHWAFEVNQQAGAVDRTESTELLLRWRDGDVHALDALLPLVYADLRAMAARVLTGHKGHDTVQPTVLVHDVIVRFIGGANTPRIDDIDHFFRVAARAMRQLLVDRARRRVTSKRGGGAGHEPFDAEAALPIDDDPRIGAVDDALRDLEQVDERLARIVELRFFVGLSVPAVARVLGVDKRTVYRDWALARIWLQERITGA